jgi:hypothetical protein
MVMVIQFLKGEYVGKSRDLTRHPSNKDCEHIKRIINQGCLSHLDFEGDYKNKHQFSRKGINKPSLNILKSLQKQ